METYQVFVFIGFLLSAALVTIELVAMRNKLKAREALINELRTRSPSQSLRESFLHDLTRLGPTEAEEKSGITDEDIQRLVEEIARTAQSLRNIDAYQKTQVVAPLLQPSQLGRLRYLRELVDSAREGEPAKAAM